MKFYLSNLLKKATETTGEKLKEVTFHLKNGEKLVIEGVTDAKFDYDTMSGQLSSWKLTFDKKEDHRDYPSYINPQSVDAITFRTYNRVL